MSDELFLDLPDGIASSEVERGQEILRDIYIRWAREKGEMSEDGERYLRGQMSEDEMKAHLGPTTYERYKEQDKQREDRRRLK